MRSALGFVLLALLACSAPASADVVGKKVNDDPESVRAYWTAERMRNATPADRVRHDDRKVRAAKPGTGGGGSGSWATLRVSWPASTITYAHGKVFFTDDGANYVCSGTAVSSVNGNVVWTAGHCVHDGPGQFHDRLSFVPGYNSDKSLGTWVASRLYTTSAWAANGQYGEDLGAAVVGSLGGQTLAQRVGATRPVGFGPDYTQGRDLNSYGYPAAGKYTGETAYWCDSYLSRVDSSATPATMGIPCGMNQGSSGGGWIDAGGNVASVNSYMYGSIKNTMFGPVHGAGAQQLFGAAENGTTAVPSAPTS